MNNVQHRCWLLFYRLSGENVVINHVMRSEQQFRLRDVVDRER